MKNLVLALALLFAFEAHSAARVYRGSINFGSNSVTTAYELVLTNTKPVVNLGCSHTSTGLSFYVSLAGAQSDCSDATDDILVSEGQSIGIGAEDKVPVGKYVCIKTVSGTASAGIFNCLGSWDGVNG